MGRGRDRQVDLPGADNSRSRLSPTSCLFGLLGVSHATSPLQAVKGSSMKKYDQMNKEELLAELLGVEQVKTDRKSTENLMQDLQQENMALRQRIESLQEEIADEKQEHAKAEQNLKISKLIVDKSPVVLFRRKAGDEPVIDFISDNFSRFGYSTQELIDGDLKYRDIVHPDDVEKLAEDIKMYADKDAEEYSQVYRIITGTGSTRWVSDTTSVVRDERGVKTHNQGIIQDITARKLAADALKKSEEKFRRIVESTDEGFVLMDESLKIIEVNNAYCRMLGYAEDEILGKAPFDFAPQQVKEYMRLNIDSYLEQEHRKFETRILSKSGQEVPILIHGNALQDDDGNFIGNMAFVTDMTEHKKALMLAGEVQKSLLPNANPRVKGLDVAGRNISCDEIGGDYFDFFWRQGPQQGPFSVVVGDIAGHGVDSALLMTTARAFLRMRASQPGTPAEIISAMNQHLTNDVMESGKFMTLFYLAIDREQKCLEWVRAGHDPALLYDPKSNDFEELRGQGIALGVAEDADYLMYRREGLVDGQIITIGTDGVWEAINREGEMFGKERLKEIIQENAAADATEILNLIYERLNFFTLGCRAEDDITLVIIKIEGIS
jgi:sigma-B regulation protein RsbU (phosphoserine phosphatase)